MAKGGGGARGGGGGLGTKGGRSAFASAAGSALQQISAAQRGMKRSSRSYQRLDSARDVLTGARWDVKMGNVSSERVARAQALLDDIGRKGLSGSVTFGKFW